MNNKNKILALFLVVLVAVLGAASLYISTKLNQQGVTPTAPGSQPQAAGCEEKCPASNGELWNCHPTESDGTPQKSVCNTAGRVESCGGVSYCCPAPGGRWTTDMTACGGAATVWVGSTACKVAGTVVSEQAITCTEGAKFSDSFGGSAVDTNKWLSVSGTGRTVTQSNGKLRVSRETTADTAIGAGIANRNLSSGDFDVSLDVDSLTAVTGAGKWATIEIATWEEGGAPISNARLIRDSGGALHADHYSKKSDGQIIDGDDYVMTNTTAKLYLQRRGNEAEAFVQDGNQKISLGKHIVYTGKPLHVEIMDWASANTTVSAVVDNMTLSCPTACTPTAVITCNPDCPTACGKVASTITTCKDSCGNNKTKQCPATAACGVPDLTIVKKAFWNETTNTAGNYTLTTEINSVSKDQIFVYAIYIENVSTVTATNVTVSDTLNGQKQDLLTFVDAQSGCNYDAGTRTVTCSGLTLAAAAKGTYAFRVKVTGNAVNGDVIKNTGKVTYGTVTKEAHKDLTVSTVVSCSNTCTTDDECDGSLVCDTASKMCRNSACSTMTNCNCPATPTATATPTTTITQGATVTPTVVASCNKACNVNEDCVAGLICDPTTSMCRKEACTSKANCLCTTDSNQAVLPEAGILDIPGVAAFGGGLLLAIIGIMLAL